MWLYRIAYVVLAGGSKVIWRIKVIGRENLPKAGGFIVTPSHRSMMDIPISGIVTTRRLRFMGKASLFRLPILGSFFRALGGFPVERDGSDRKAVRDSVELLLDGEILCVFPEGTRQNGDDIQPLQPGAAYLSLRAQVPIVPIGMAGTEQIMRSRKNKFFPGFERVVMVLGEPLVPPVRETSTVPRALVDEFTVSLSKELQAAYDEANRIRSGT